MKTLAFILLGSGTLWEHFDPGEPYVQWSWPEKPVFLYLRLYFWAFSCLSRLLWKLIFIRCPLNTDGSPAPTPGLKSNLYLVWPLPFPSGSGAVNGIRPSQSDLTCLLSPGPSSSPPASVNGLPFHLEVLLLWPASNPHIQVLLASTVLMEPPKCLQNLRLVQASLSLLPELWPSSSIGLLWNHRLMSTPAQKLFIVPTARLTSFHASWNWAIWASWCYLNILRSIKPDSLQVLVYLVQPHAYFQAHFHDHCTPFLQSDPPPTLLYVSGAPCR